MEYKLLKSQKEFIEIPHKMDLDVCVYQGGFGSGKTFAGSLLGLLLAIKYPKILGLVGAQTYALVRDTTLNSYFEHLERFRLKEDKDYYYSKSEQKLELANGSVIMFRHFDEPNKLKSLNLGFAEIEEMSDVPYETFKMLLGRMRQIPVNSWNNFQYRIFGHTNPEPCKGWIYKTFKDNPKKNYRLIIAPTTENIYLPKGYCEELKGLYDEKYYKMNVLGQFDDSKNNLVVKDFSDENVLKLNYDEDIELHITCDFNVDPMAWILAYKDNKKVYFIDEIVLENTTTVRCCEEFYARYKNHRAKIIINGDASGDNRSTQSEFTNYVLMRNRLSSLGFKDIEIKIRNFNPPIKNRVMAFNSMIKSFSGERRIFIDPKCEKLLYNIQNLKYKEGSSSLDLPTYYQIQANPEVKFLGHPFDAASYLVEYYFPIMKI